MNKNKYLLIFKKDLFLDHFETDIYFIVCTHTRNPILILVLL